MLHGAFAKSHAFLTLATNFSSVIFGLYERAANSGSGQLFYYQGTSSGLPAGVTATRSAGAAGDQFGFSVAIAGDVNGDGIINETFSIFRRDVVVGAPNAANGGYSGAGKAYLFNGTSSGLSTTAYWSSSVNQAGAKFGFSVAGNANIDLRNNKDFVVGAPYYDANATDSGAVFAFRSNETGNPQTGSIHQMATGQVGARLGYSVCLGDLREPGNVGASDVIAGAPWFDSTSNDDKGKVFIFEGRFDDSPVPTPSSQWGQVGNPTGLSNGAHLGKSVTYIFKVNSPFDNKCIATGAPEAQLQLQNGAGLVQVWELQP
ncbi:MAG: integrin alpha [Terriglobia bacterium]